MNPYAPYQAQSGHSSIVAVGNPYVPGVQPMVVQQGPVPNYAQQDQIARAQAVAARLGQAQAAAQAQPPGQRRVVAGAVIGGQPGLMVVPQAHVSVAHPVHNVQVINVGAGHRAYDPTHQAAGQDRASR